MWCQSKLICSAMTDRTWPDPCESQDWTRWCKTAKTCVGNGHYPVHYWVQSDHWKKASQIWWRCSIVLFLSWLPAYDSLRTLLYWLTVWAVYHFEKAWSSGKNVQIPALQLEAARSSDKASPMQIQCKYVCRPTHGSLTVPSARLYKSYSTRLRVQYIYLTCTNLCTHFPLPFC